MSSRVGRFLGCLLIIQLVSSRNSEQKLSNRKERGFQQAFSRLSSKACDKVLWKRILKREFRRKMNFTHGFGFVVLIDRDIVKSFRWFLLRFRERRPGRIEHEVTRGQDVVLRRKGSQINCLFRVRHISSDTCLSKSDQKLPSSSSTLSSSDSSGAWISSHFRIEVRSADECVAPGRRQPGDIHWTSDGRFSSPETNLKVVLLPLFFMQLLLSPMFLSFMVRTSPLKSKLFSRVSKFPHLSYSKIFVVFLKHHLPLFQTWRRSSQFKTDVKFSKREVEELS